jgi:hypothetical protein
MGAVEAGWYPDPRGGDSERWWDGEGWTAATRLATAPPVDSPTAVRARVAVPARGPVASTPPPAPPSERAGGAFRYLVVGALGLVVAAGVVATVLIAGRDPAAPSVADADELTVVTPEARERDDEGVDDPVVDEPVLEDPVDEFLVEDDGLREDGLEDDGLEDDAFPPVTDRGGPGSPPEWVADEVVERRDGFQLVDGGAWDPDATLNAVVGRRASDGRSHVFLFVEGRGFIGTDTYAPSRHGLAVSPRAADMVVVVYEVVDDAGVAAGTVEVRYRWQGEELAPLDEIPPLPGEGSGPYR